MNDFLLGSKRIHTVVLVVILILAAFLRWYRLDNCVMCSQDEWMSLTATFYFLQKVANHGIFSATAFEFSAGFPLADVGRLGPPFDYTRSLMLIWTMPYYAVVALFDFPVSEGWYRFPGTLWAFPALVATYFFIYQLTRRHIAALAAVAMQATLLGHIVLTRIFVADMAFPFFYALTAGFWLKYVRDRQPRTRHWAYFTAMLYISSTPEGVIGLVSIVMLVILVQWQSSPASFPTGWLQELRSMFVAWPALWVFGFYAYQGLVEAKLYLFDRDNFLNHANYLGRMFGRGTGQIAFLPERLWDWYFYPNISAALILAALLSLLRVKNKTWRAALLFGWFWVIFWLVLTVTISNSSSNFIRIMHPMLILGAIGITAVYDWHSSVGTAFAGGLVVLNVIGVYTYPLLCPLPENQNVAQAVGYLVQEYGDEWGGASTIGFFFPTQSLQAYLPLGTYTEIGFQQPPRFGECMTELLPETVENLEVIFALPTGYDTRQQISRNLDFAISHDCEQKKNAVLNHYAEANGFHLVGTIQSEDGKIHANIWSKLPLDLGVVSIERANNLHYEKYSRRSWFSWDEDREW
ncbi:MAG: phospholipid carrier-dependent glycosyltransferase [Anaerolineae bacterium]|nr:phospholipid carrier-dependent glycosyltransferase [Anaerolineae bacterium]